MALPPPSPFRCLSLSQIKNKAVVLLNPQEKLIASLRSEIKRLQEENERLRAVRGRTRRDQVIPGRAHLPAMHDVWPQADRSRLVWHGLRPYVLRRAALGWAFLTSLRAKACRWRTC